MGFSMAVFDCHHDMAGDFCQHKWSDREQDRSIVLKSSPESDISICRAPLVIKTNPDVVWEGTTLGHEQHQIGTIWDHF